MRIIDSHHHLWSASDHHYPLLAGPMHERGWGDWSALRANYLVTDFLHDARNQSLVKSVHVQANFDPTDPVGETKWLDEVANRPESLGFPHGIVAFANFGDAHVEELLELHARYPRVRGVRQVLNRHANPIFNRAEHDWLAMPEWRNRLSLLRQYNWSFDVQVYHHQMVDVARLAGRYDDMQFVLDHVGMPVDRDQDSLAAWRAGMQLVADCPNVAVKLSGYGMTDRTWTADSMRQFVLSPIEWFGPERVMFGSNFPIDKLMADYDRLWNTYAELTAGFSASERTAMFHDNAQRIYRL